MGVEREGKEGERDSLGETATNGERGRRAQGEGGRKGERRRRRRRREKKGCGIWCISSSDSALPEPPWTSPPRPLHYDSFISTSRRAHALACPLCRSPLLSLFPSRRFPFQRVSCHVFCDNLHSGRRRFSCVGIIIWRRCIVWLRCVGTADCVASSGGKHGEAI